MGVATMFAALGRLSRHAPKCAALAGGSWIFSSGYTDAQGMWSGSAKKDTPSIKLYYGQLHFWRAECVRMCLFMGDVAFEDVRYDKRSDPLFIETVKPKLTFGQTPVMEVDGKILSQTAAMAGYAARLAGMMPSDPWLAAKVDEAIHG